MRSCIWHLVHPTPRAMRGILTTMQVIMLGAAFLVSLLLNGYFILKTHNVDPVACASSTPEVHTDVANGVLRPFLRVVDGDTVIIGVEDRTEYVRLIGVAAPEPNNPGETSCQADAATAHLQELTQTGLVLIERDSAQATRDTYGRLLAFVQLPDGSDLGEAMVRDGYVRVLPAPHVRRDVYVEAEQRAQQQGLGLWGTSTCNTTND